jgi:microcystin-dependent protein
MVRAMKLTRAAAIVLTGLSAAVTPVQAQPAPFYLGQVIFLAADYCPYSTVRHDDYYRGLPIQNFTDLYMLMGTAYGGDGVMYFELPSLEVPTQTAGTVLNDCVVNNGPSPRDGKERSLPAVPLYLSQIISLAVPSFATFKGCPVGTLPADGRLMPISENQALFGLVQTSYGGDGSTNFALPKLRMQSKTGDELSTCIVTQGKLPPREEAQPPPVSSYFSQILFLATDYCPSGTLPTDGRLMPIPTHNDEKSAVLFSLVGTQYGGDGKTNFALPNLVMPGKPLENPSPTQSAGVACIVTQGEYPLRR